MVGVIGSPVISLPLVSANPSVTHFLVTVELSVVGVCVIFIISCPPIFKIPVIVSPDVLQKLSTMYFLLTAE